MSHFGGDDPPESLPDNAHGRADDAQSADRDEDDEDDDNDNDARPDEAPRQGTTKGEH
jgi:hypothetical protein